MSDRVDVERLGGFAGFGGPGSHLKSRGSLALADLAADDRRAVEALFVDDRGSTGAAHPDGFHYRVTVGGRSVDVDEGLVPRALRDCVKDELA